MQHPSKTGRTARRTTSPLCPNSPAPHATEVRRAPELPPGARCVGSVRIPLTLTVAPRAHLYVIPGGQPVWWVRLPALDGTPRWCALSRTEPVRWAIASRLPHVARAALRLLARLAPTEVA